MKKHLRPSPAMIVAMVALTAALGGTSYAATTLAKNTVGSQQLRKGAVKNGDIGKNAVTAAKVKNRSLLAVDFKAGQLPAGPAGPAGPTGLTGPTGPIGPSNAFVAADDSHNIGIPDASHTVVTEDLPAGDYTFTASAGIENISGVAAEYTCSIIAKVGIFDETLGAVHVSLGASELAPIAVTGATHTDGTTAELRCLSTDGGDFGLVTVARLISTRVGAVN
jgi:hypothetical protein